MIFDVKALRHRWLKKIIPVIVILTIMYMDYATFYSLGYQEVYKYHSHGAAIVLWTLVPFCQLTALLYWILIFYYGPGKQPTFPAFNLHATDNEELTSVPDIFLCDEYGFPHYCSTSNSVKIARTFLLKDVGYLTLKFDHYCVWIGAVIGEGNHVFFIKLTTWLVGFLLVSLVYLIRYTPLNVSRGEINHNFIPLYILCGFWILMISALTTVHLKYILYNMTTLDDITINQKKIYMNWKSKNQGKKVKKRNVPRVESGNRFVSIRDKEGVRVVVGYDVTELPFSLGITRNVINFVYNGNRNHGLSESMFTRGKLIQAILVMLIPYVDLPIYTRSIRKPFKGDDTLGYSDLKLEEYEYYGSEFSEEFKKSLYERIERKECYLPLYAKV